MKNLTFIQSCSLFSQENDTTLALRNALAYKSNMYISIMSPFLSSNCQLKKILWYRVVPLHLIRNPPIKYLFVPYGMKLQLSKLRLLRITFYVVQRTSEIIHNLCPDPINYLGRSFRHILEYLQTSSLPNILNCDTT